MRIEKLVPTRGVASTPTASAVTMTAPVILVHRLTADTTGFAAFVLTLGPFGGSHQAGTPLLVWSAAFLFLVGAAALTELDPLGVAVGRRTDFYGWPNPSGLGWTLIVLTDLVVWYLVSIAAVAAWRAVRRAHA